MEKDAQARDIELENIVGNLLIAEYQVEKLRDRVISRISSVYPSGTNKKVSTHIFKSNGTWVKVSINVEKMTTGNKREIQDEIQETE
jgi:hypothetical protein